MANFKVFLRQESFFYFISLLTRYFLFFPLPIFLYHTSVTPSFSFHLLPVPTFSLFFSLFKVSCVSVGFSRREDWKQEAGDPDWLSLTFGVALTASRLSFTIRLFLHSSSSFFLLQRLHPEILRSATSSLLNIFPLS